jgi:hypothetical protein
VASSALDQCVFHWNPEIGFMLRRSCVLILFPALLAAGCGSPKADTSEERLKSMAGGQLKEVVPVSGIVYVDGTPTAGVNLYLYKAEGGPSVLNCRSGEGGKYCWTSHLECDGLEVGSYRLGFAYIPKPKKNDKGVDSFKGKYKDPLKNEFQLKVEKGAPQTAVEYKLVSK